MALDASGNYVCNLPDEVRGNGTGGSVAFKPQTVTGAFDDPNGNVTPDDTTKPAIYYKDQASPVIEYNWSVANQNWYPVIT